MQIQPAIVEGGGHQVGEAVFGHQRETANRAIDRRIRSVESVLDNDPIARSDRARRDALIENESGSV